MSKRIEFSFPPLFEWGKPLNYLEFWDKSSYFCIECGTQHLWERHFFEDEDLDSGKFFCTNCGTAFEIAEGIFTAPKNAVHKARTEQLLKED